MLVAKDVANFVESHLANLVDPLTDGALGESLPALGALQFTVNSEVIKALPAFSKDLRLVACS
jgi:hypothetical protein